MNLKEIDSTVFVKITKSQIKKNMLSIKRLEKIILFPKIFLKYFRYRILSYSSFPRKHHI